MISDFSFTQYIVFIRIILSFYIQKVIKFYLKICALLIIQWLFKQTCLVNKEIFLLFVLQFHIREKTWKGMMEK